MKKVLSMLMAAAMIVSASSTLMFAKTTVDNSTSLDSGVLDSGVANADKVQPRMAYLYVEDREYTTSLNTDTVDVGRDGVDALYKALNGATFKNVLVNGKSYTAKLVYRTNSKAKAAGGRLDLELSPKVGIGYKNVTFSVAVSAAVTTGNTTSTKMVSLGSGTIQRSTTSLNGDITADLTMDNISVRVSDIIYCDPNGDPVPLVENDASAESGDSNGVDAVRGAKTLYFEIYDGGYNFDDDSYWKLRITKGDNGKYIKKISDVSKKFSKSLHTLDGDPAPTTGVERHRYIKVEMNDIYTDDEYKITLDMRLTPKQKAVNAFKVDDDAEIKIKDFSFYYKNAERTADNEWKVGINGLMLNPLENDWNEVTYYDEDNDVAFMKFFADSDVDKFYAKLSTKWPHEDYAAYFNDQDSYLFDFTGSPKISATSRCDLQIYNPFVDDDGNETIDPTTATIYQIIDGDLYDVTESFTYQEGDNGDMAFTCRTRFLGTYVICEKPVDEAL